MCTLDANELVGMRGDFLFGGGDDSFKTGLFLLCKRYIGCAYLRTLNM